MPSPSRMFLSSTITALAVLTAPAWAAEDLLVKYDQAQLLKLSRPVAEIIVGNPTIADVAVQAATLLVVTGKTFGITNLIVLDSERNIVLERRILVRRDERKVVNLQRGAQRQSYNCTPQCNPSLTVGDDSAFFEATAKTAERKVKFSEGHAETTGQGGGH